MNSIPRLVSDLRALEAAWERQPLLCDGLGGFDDVFSLDLAQQLIASNLPLPWVRLFVGGEPVDPKRYARPREPSARGTQVFADAAAVLRHVGAGATLALEELQTFSPPVAAFAADLARFTGYRVDCTAFLTPAQAKGVSPHYDVASVLLRQVHGAKRWRIYEPARRWPTLEWRPGNEVATRLVLDVTLEEGQSLYIPRGFVHVGETSGRPSAHLTLGLHGQTWADLLQRALADAASEREELREALPPAFSARDREQLFRDRAALLADVLEKLPWPDDGRDDGWANTGRRPPPPGALAVALASTTPETHHEDGTQQ
jgi:lysine-specific demethylase/histidyl-hydroxylase NO66